MSLLELEDDLSNEGSLSIEEEVVDDKVPMAVLVMIERLPPKKQVQLQRAPYAQPKVSIRFMAIGLAPPLRPNVYNISSTQTVATLVRFLQKKLRMDEVHLYVQSSFAPTPDETIGDLWESFRVGNELVVSYCHQVAFG